MKVEAKASLSYFVNFCNSKGWAAKSYLSFGTDPIDEFTRLAERVLGEFPNAIFFTSKLIFERRQLVHPDTAQSGGDGAPAPFPSARHADDHPADKLASSLVAASRSTAKFKPVTRRTTFRPRQGARGEIFLKQKRIRACRHRADAALFAVLPASSLRSWVRPSAP